MNQAYYNFHRDYRLLKSQDYSRVFALPFRHSDQCFIVFARSNSCSHARLGLAVQKKYLRTSVSRNGVKRVIRESFRKNFSLLPSIDIVVMAGKKIYPYENPVLFSSLENHWSKVTEFFKS